jgi:histidinol dehydrogenase
MVMAEIRILDSRDPGFLAGLDGLLAWESVSDGAVNQRVNQILADVRAQGDAALLDYTRRFDGWEPVDAADLILPRPRLEQAYTHIPAEQRAALERSRDRIRAFAERQLLLDWSYTEQDGTLLGQKVTPLDRVGLYVPGGKAAYPSSVLMNAIPAKVAGVGELIMVVPMPHGEKNALVLAAARITGIDRIFTIGGAQAIGALAYGTQTIAQVDKITGPGNAYVAAAKRRVFGTVGIDMVAGPSEVLIISDGHGNPDWVAMDLFAQAEHDELAQSILLCTSATFIDAVYASIETLLPQMPRRQTIAASLANRGALIHVTDLDEACAIANRIAPEHLELCVDNAERWIDRIRHAGAIFVGHYSVEALGDYCAGPNHVLPTMRSARFSSPLGVYDFQKRTSIIRISAQGADRLGRIASTLAHGEGLQAHARSAEMRLKN